MGSITCDRQREKEEKAREEVLGCSTRSACFFSSQNDISAVACPSSLSSHLCIRRISSRRASPHVELLPPPLSLHFVAGRLFARLCRADGVSLLPHFFRMQQRCTLSAHSLFRHGECISDGTAAPLLMIHHGPCKRHHPSIYRCSCSMEGKDDSLERSNSVKSGSDSRSSLRYDAHATTNRLV